MCFCSTEHAESMMPSQTNYQSSFGPVAASFQQLANSGNAAAAAAAAAAASMMVNGQLRSFSSCASHSNCPSASTSTTSSGVSTASFNSNSCHHFGANGVPFTLSASRTSPPVEDVAAAAAASSSGFASSSSSSGHGHCMQQQPIQPGAAVGGRMATSLYKPHEPYFNKPQSNSATAGAVGAQHHSPPTATQSSLATGDPDRPVGYGAFGVVWCAFLQFINVMYFRRIFSGAHPVTCSALSSHMILRSKLSGKSRRELFSHVIRRYAM